VPPDRVWDTTWVGSGTVPWLVEWDSTWVGSGTVPGLLVGQYLDLSFNFT